MHERRIVVVNNELGKEAYELIAEKEGIQIRAKRIRPGTINRGEFIRAVDRLVGRTDGET